jgi:hypothetical protein
MAGEEMSNTFRGSDGHDYFWEVSTDKEYRDGHITGKVFLYIGNNRTSGAWKDGTFSIRPNGTIHHFSHLPKKVKEYAENCLTNAFVVIHA